MSLHGWRIAVLALMLSSLLVACGSAPTSTPSRASYPDGSKTEDDLEALIKEFLGQGNEADRATDQLLNAIYLLTRSERPTDSEMERLKRLILKPLRDVN